ncbi:MAG: YraN family protein [Clostridiales bacterium]|nr:YraN family protein [Clostridiales bacterium]
MRTESAGGSREKGIAGENAAAEYLRLGGYEILGRNYSCRQGEIDIIAQNGGYLIFVEVKSRKSYSCGAPAEAVTPSKQRKIRQAALHYIESRGVGECDCRFDVLEVRFSGGTGVPVGHILNAF